MHKTEKPSLYWNWIPAAFALAGIILFIFATFGPPASSSGFVSMLKGIFQTVSKEYVESKEHYRMIPDTGSWIFAFVLGMAIGGFIAARSFPVPVQDVPEIWEQRFGPGKAKRYAVTFIGGFLILFASRLAGGCTLGLFISGSTQLAVSGLWFGVLIFAAAMITAKILYKGITEESAGKEKK
ncbi:MAG: YeeE/YedE thiosulfate transporter family protein [Desulfococcaceae bacterium]|jgi:uncharacterized membrane protein YedE/YeeE|nr:YeeE/YedE thiosulfate transporter family protein [Desulfococcaceae bacterium]